MEERALPKGLRISSIIYYVLAGLQVGSLIGYGIILLLIASLSGKTIGSIITIIAQGSSIPSWLIIAILIFIAVFIAAMSLLYFYTGKGLGEGRSWARITSIVISILAITGGILSTVISGMSTLFTADLSNLFTLTGGLTSIPSLLITFGIHGTVAYFLLLDKEVKDFYSQEQRSNH